LQESGFGCNDYNAAAKSGTLAGFLLCNRHRQLSNEGEDRAWIHGSM
jgi:hypothetical protein